MLLQFRQSLERLERSHFFRFQTLDFFEQKLSIFIRRSKDINLRLRLEFLLVLGIARIDLLLFEAQNEELGWDSIWNRYSGTNGAEKKASFDLVNKVNQAFVDTVRATGGNNEKRHLLISGYNTDVDLTCDKLFTMPDDPAGRLAVSMHYYNPSTLTIIDKDVSNRMASTIRHNRARGSHSIELMMNIVGELKKAGMSDQWIMKEIGMDADELLRFKQLSGLAELFKDREYSKATEL